MIIKLIINSLAFLTFLQSQSDETRQVVVNTNQIVHYIQEESITNDYHHFSFILKNEENSRETFVCVTNNSGKKYIFSDWFTNATVRPQLIEYGNSIKLVFVRNEHKTDKSIGQLVLCELEDYSCEIIYEAEMQDLNKTVIWREFKIIKTGYGLEFFLRDYSRNDRELIHIRYSDESKFIKELDTGFVGDVKINKNHLLLSYIHPQIDLDIANYAHQSLLLNVYDLDDMGLVTDEIIHFGLDYHVKTAVKHLYEDKLVYFYTVDENDEAFSIHPDVLYMRTYSLLTGEISDKVRLFDSLRQDVVSGISQMESFHYNGNHYLIFEFVPQTNAPLKVYLMEINAADGIVSEPEVLVEKKFNIGFDYTFEDGQLNLFYFKLAADRQSNEIFKYEVNLEDVEIEYELNNSITARTNFPNPFNSQTTLDFTIYQESDITIDVIDVNGRIISSESLGRLSRGNYQHRLTLTNTLATGVYFYRIIGSSGVADGQMFFVK